MELTKGTKIKVFTITQRKYEGELNYINSSYILFKDKFDNKNRIVSLLNVSEIEVDPSDNGGKNDGEEEKREL